MHLVAQNEAASKMMGWSSDEIVGTSICDLAPSNQALFSKLCQLLDQALKETQTITFHEGLLLARKAARPVLVAGRVVPILQDERSVGAICAFWEISPEKDNSFLRLEFANMASHLLRTPLSFIHASIEFLMSSNLEAEHQEVLGKMRSQSRRLTDFTNELLKILRSETEVIAVHIEAVDLLPLIERVLNFIQSERPSHKFHLKAPVAPPKVAADPVKVELVLLNLLLNVLKRCPSHGHITVEVKNSRPEVIISIMDDGTPIPTELLDKVFWPYYPVDGSDNKMPSTYNLGLYNTKRLVEVQDGQIWVESQHGQGSQFSFSLPSWEYSKQ